MVNTTTTGSTLLRPDSGTTFIEVPTVIYEQALAELRLKAHLAKVGIEDLTAADKLLLYWLKDCGAF